MKLLTLNFLTCAIKACKSSPSSYPLHVRDATLERTSPPSPPSSHQPTLLPNILPRLDWPALLTTATELGLAALVPASRPEGDALTDDAVMGGLHRVLIETEVVEGKLVCGNCGHEYAVKEGVANFLLPAHLV